MKTETVADFRFMRPEEARALSCGDHPWIIVRDGSARTVKVNGTPKTWKRDAARLEIPVKYGMYEYATLVAREHSPGEWRIEEWGGSGAALLVRISEIRTVARAAKS